MTASQILCKVAVLVTNIARVGSDEPGLTVTFSYVPTDGSAATVTGVTATTVDVLSQPDACQDLKVQIAGAINNNQDNFFCGPQDILLLPYAIG